MQTSADLMSIYLNNDHFIALIVKGNYENEFVSILNRILELRKVADMEIAQGNINLITTAVFKKI